MPPKGKGKAPPKPTAASELASALGVAKFSRIKHGDLQHEANVKRPFSVPGSYWNAQCTDGDENQMYSAQVVEVCLTHKFQGTSMRQPAVRFVLTGAAASTVDNSPSWLALDEYSKLTDKIRRTEREDADKAAEAAKVAASGINEVVQAGGGAAVEEVELTPAEKQRRNMKAPVYQHWSSPVLLQTAMRPHPTKTILDANGVETPVMVAHHQWQFTCQELLPASEGGDGEKKCLHQRIEWNGSNGNLFKHCEAKHPDLHKTLSANSKHTSKQVVDGVLTSMLTWEQKFPHHAAYTVETYLDYAPFTRCRKDGNRGVCSSLKPGYVPPCTETQHQIMEVMEELEDEEIRQDMARWRAEIGPGFLGEATDGMTSDGNHFVTFNGSVIEDNPLRVERFVLDYHEYAGSGDADKLAEDWKKTENLYGIIASDRGTPTADGAAPQQKAIQILTGKDGRRCANHQEARAALEAIKTKNPEANKVIKKYRGLSRFAKRSTAYKNDIKAHEQQVMSVTDAKQMTLPNETRWMGNITTIQRTNEKEPAIRKLHAPLEDDGTVTSGALTLTDADSSSDSDSDEGSEDEEEEQEKMSKNARKYRARVESKSLLSSDWASGKDLESCWRNSVEFILFMQTQKRTTLEHRLPLARALIVVNTSPIATRLQMTKTTLSDGSVTYSRDEVEIEASELMPCAQTFRQVYAASMEQRFFSNHLIADEDLIALMLNWVVNYKSTLGYDRPLIARAETVFSAALVSVEEELEDAAIAKRPAKKLKQRSFTPAPAKKGGLMALTMSGDYSTTTTANEEDDDDDDDDVMELTTVDRLNKFRCLEGKARSDEIIKYLDEDGAFSLLKFLGEQRATLKPAFVLGRRTLPHPAGQAVSESTFSTHAAFDSDLRKNLGNRATARMVKLNKNHARYFLRIKPLIKGRYDSKFGRDAAKAKASAANAAAASAASDITV